jgi:uncharacterized protein YyaL (SSP411 family)
MPSIEWCSWNADSFARARAENKPVLLCIAPSWCRYSRDMDRTSYADGGICSIVNSRFVAIRVDADRRPDLGERYGLGGWPTTAFLTADGQIVGGGTHIAVARLADALERVAAAFASGRHLGPRQTTRAQRSAHGCSPASSEQLVDQVLDDFDPIHGGFCASPKFPHVAPVRLAIALYKETGAQQYFDIAVKSLDAMGWGPLYDEQRGGFFSYSQDADWASPNEAKRLDVNAALLSLYVEALETLRLARYGERAEDVLRYTQTWLADPVDGGWAASQFADAGYYARHDAPDSAAPGVDRTLYSDWNAAMISASMQAGRVLGDASLAEFAIKSLERIVLLGYRPGAGIAHYVEAGAPQVTGLLADQIAMAVANLDAFDATGNVVYEMMAEELAWYAMRTMWDEASDGFFDRAGDPRRDIGLLKEPVKPFAVNCQAARMLSRVAQTSGSAELASYAERTLTAISARAAAEGPAAAEYVLSLRQSSPR